VEKSKYLRKQFTDFLVSNNSRLNCGCKYTQLIDIDDFFFKKNSSFLLMPE